MIDPQQNVALVRRLYEAMAAADFETIVAIVDPDVVITQTPELPWGGEFHGHAGLAEFAGKLTDTIRSRVTHHAVFAAGERVVQVGKTAGTVNATGASFDIDEVHVHTMRDGKIVRFEAHIDTPAMLAVLGTTPGPS
jgi:ketosteroid isomerase-like protein